MVTNPSFCSRTSASRSGVLLTPNRGASSASRSTAPGSSAPLMMSSRNCWYTVSLSCRCTPSSTACVIAGLPCLADPGAATTEISDPRGLDPVQDPREARVGLAQDLRLVHGQQLAAAHQDPAVDDGGVDRAAVGREDQGRVQLVGVTRDQWGEHDVARVNQDHVGLAPGPELAGVVAQGRGP